MSLLRHQDNLSVTHVTISRRGLPRRLRMEYSDSCIAGLKNFYIGTSIVCVETRDMLGNTFVVVVSDAMGFLPITPPMLGT